MVKRSIGAFRPTGLRTARTYTRNQGIGEDFKFRPIYLPSGRFYSTQQVDKIIELAGGLPTGLGIEEIPAGPSRYVLSSDRADDGTPIADMASKTTTFDRRTRLEAGLNASAKQWDLARQWSTKPTARQLEKRFEQIEAAAEKLRIALGLARDPPGRLDRRGLIEKIPRALRYGQLQAWAEKEAQGKHPAVPMQVPPGTSGEDLLIEAASGVYRLREWSRRARRRSAKPLVPSGATKREKRNEGNEALDQLLGNLTSLWVQVFERGPSAGEKGRYIRYLHACLKPLLGGSTPDLNALRKRAERLGLHRPGTS